jgi:hypothetical protein
MNKSFKMKIPVTSHYFLQETTGCNNFQLACVCSVSTPHLAMGIPLFSHYDFRKLKEEVYQTKPVWSIQSEECL